MSIELTTFEKQSATWLKLLVHLQERIGVLQAQISGDMSEEQTWKYRGRIAELKALTLLDEDYPEIEKNTL